MPKFMNMQSMQTQPVNERFPHLAWPNLWRGAMYVLLTAWLLAGAASAHAQANQDWQPPGFALPRADGTEFRYPEDLAGPTIILFWATWCPYCKALMPHLQSILDEYPGQLQVLALSIRDDGDPAATLAEYGFDFTLFTTADAVAEAWGVKGTPGLFLADGGGRVVFDRMRLPPAAERAAAQPLAAMKHYQKAARNAPYWAARLRVALDQLQH
jgi:thiol-disulfide isomerase/thioredoxin